VGDALPDLGEGVGGEAAAVEPAGRGAAPDVRRAELLERDGDRAGVAAPAREGRRRVAGGPRRRERRLLGRRDPALALLLGADHLPQLALHVVEDGLALGEQALHLPLLRRRLVDGGRGLALVCEQLGAQRLEAGPAVLQRAHHPGVHLADLVEQVELVGRGGDAAGRDEHLREGRRGVRVEVAQPRGEPRLRPLQVGLRAPDLTLVALDAHLHQPQLVAGAVVGLGRPLDLGVDRRQLRPDPLHLGALLLDRRRLGGGDAGAEEQDGGGREDREAEDGWEPGGQGGVLPVDGDGHREPWTGGRRYQRGLPLHTAGYELATPACCRSPIPQRASHASRGPGAGTGSAMIGA
jgi:hypothetical protein